MRCWFFRAETWVINPQMERALENFQHRVARRITVKQPRQRVNVSWEYLPLEEARGEAGFEGIRKSFTRRQNTVLQYIATRPILDLCERATRRTGARVSRRWWEQAGIDLEGVKKMAAEVEADLESDLDLGREESSGASGSSGA